MNIPKLRNKLFPIYIFYRNLILLVFLSGILLSAQKTVEEAASVWLANSQKTEQQQNEPIDFHPTEILNIIALEGHSLPQHIKNDLVEIGFDFSGEIVTRGRPFLGQDAQFIDSGIFRFHYTLSGVHAVLPEDDDGNGIPDYVEIMKQSFDDIAVIDFEIQNYVLPPSDSWYTNQDAGGSWHFDVYIYQDDPGVYGYVQAENYAQHFSETTRGDNENSSEIVENNAIVSFMGMRNNYNGFSGTESSNIQVTSAHEFFHAIQYGYDAWEKDWLKEATATWMEEVHYDDVNDCYQYLPLYFNSPDLGPNIETLRMYGSYIYIAYLVDNHFGENLIKLLWERSILHDSYDDTDYSIITLKESMDELNPLFSSEVFNDNQFEKITNDFLISNVLMTNDSSLYNPIYHYDEVSNENWPITDPVFEQQFESLGSEPILVPNKLVGTFGAHYYLIDVSESTLSNVSIELLPQYPEEGNLYLTIINNQDIQTTHMDEIEQVVDVTESEALIFFVSAFTYTFSDLLYTFRIVPNPTVSTENLAINSNYFMPHAIILKGNYPNPFNSQTTLNYTLNHTGTLMLEIFNLSGKFIKKYHRPSQNPGEYSINWDGTDKFGNQLESGIYFYTLDLNGEFIDSRKMVLLK